MTGCKHDIYYYSGVFTGSVLITFLFSSIQLFRIMYFTSRDRHKIHKVIMSLVWFANILMIIQSIDPEGYLNRIPRIIEVLASDLTAISCLCILFLLILQFIKIFEMNAAIDLWTVKMLFSKENVFWVLLIIFSIVTSVTFSCLQVYLDRSTFRGIKLILYSIMVIVSTIRLDRFLYSTYRVVIDQGKDPFRLLFYGILFNIFSVFIAIYQLVTGSITIHNDIDTMDELHSDSIIFPLSELLGILLITFFLSKVEYTGYNRDTLLGYPVSTCSSFFSRL